jgi:hypothetical protein
MCSAAWRGHCQGKILFYFLRKKWVESATIRPNRQRWESIIEIGD